MANPSLLIIPDRYKAAKLYSQLPESGDGDFVVTRGTTATRVNASGLIESVASGVPRLDYTGGGCPSLLVEPAATNLLQRSEEFDDAYWVKAGTTVDSNSIISPSGTFTADKIEEQDAVAGTKQVSATLSQTAGAKAFSFFAKKDERTEVGIVTTGGGMSQQDAVFNIDAGTLVSGNGAIYDYGNGWYRCVQFFTTLDNANITLRVRPLVSGSNSYTGVLGFGIFIWGAQLETGSVATSYIPTVASTVTRNADVISLSSASGLIGQSEGTLYAEVDVRALGIQRGFISVNLNSNTTDIVSLQILASNFINARLRTQTGSLIDVTTSGAVSGSVKVACSYSSGNLTMAINGVIIGTNTNATVNFTNPLNFISIGSGPAAVSGGTQSSFLNDRISAAAIYTSRLSNSELASLTSL